MKLAWPDSLVVAGTVVPVFYVPKLSNAGEFFWKPKLRITVRSRLSPVLRLNTLIHEALHAWFFISGPRNPDADVLGGAVFDEEQCINMMAGAVSALLMDNVVLRELIAALGKRRLT